MAFMYPMHFPSVPLRWDEPAWAVPCTDSVDELLLSRLESRINAQVKLSLHKGVKFLVALSLVVWSS